MFDQFLDARGGAEALARALSVPVNTVRVWRTRGFIPRARWPEIIEAFPELTLAELKHIEAVGQVRDTAA